MCQSLQTMQLRSGLRDVDRGVVAGVRYGDGHFCWSSSLSVWVSQRGRWGGRSRGKRRGGGSFCGDISFWFGGSQGVGGGGRSGGKSGGAECSQARRRGSSGGRMPA